VTSRFTSGLSSLTAGLLLLFLACASLAERHLGPGNDELRFQFEDYVLDTDRRELRRGVISFPSLPGLSISSTT